MQSQLLLPLFSSIVGAIIGASFAFFYQNKMEIKKEKRAVLQVLMAYRYVGAGELEWIKALNIIDLVYHDQRHIVELYHKFVSYTEPGVYHTNQYYEVFCQMVWEMAKCTGYKNLTETDIRRTYAPEALTQHYPHRFAKIDPSNSTSSATSSTTPEN